MTAKKPPIEIKNPAKSWSACWLDQGYKYCPSCKKGKRPEFDLNNAADCVKKYALESAEKLVKKNNTKGHN